MSIAFAFILIEISERLVLSAIGAVFHFSLEDSGNNILGVRFDEK